MAIVLPIQYCIHTKPFPRVNPNFRSSVFLLNRKDDLCHFSSFQPLHERYGGLCIVNGAEKESDQSSVQREDDDNIGVKAALAVLTFYKREISPLMPKSCRYVPTCSEYSMIAYKKYGFAKGSILTAWRLCRCNPLGGSGFDPPRWFNESSPPHE